MLNMMTVRPDLLEKPSNHLIQGWESLASSWCLSGMRHELHLGQLQGFVLSVNLAGEVVLDSSAKGFCHVLTDVVRRQRVLAESESDRAFWCG